MAPNSRRRKPSRKKRLRRVVKLPPQYFQAIELAHVVFPPLYQFENGLRLVVHTYLSTCYGSDWWDISLKLQLPAVHEYVENQKKRLDSMPWLGASSQIEVLPVHLVTLGLLEEIVKKYQSDCIPELFPTLDFFTGHMEIIKRVRNMYAHMFPCITSKDCRIAKSEIRTLAEHINTHLP